MRFIVFAVLFSLIYLSNGQHLASSNPFANPSSGLSAFSRLLGWFRRPDRQNVEYVPVASDQLMTDDYSSQLPRDSTDRMISDAISDRLLQESREHQSIVGSPFINDHEITNQRPTSDLTEQATNLNLNERDGYGRNMADSPTDSISIAEALRIVNSSNLTDCVARVICELSCNANAFGNQGRIVFRNLIKLQFDQNVRSEDAKFFRQAASKGMSLDV